MLSENILMGSALSEKTICLTFDDGPGKPYLKKTGPQTLEIAKYLHSEGIVATFFMVGKYIKIFPEIVRAVYELGHIIGNHTTSHPDMNRSFSKGKNMTSELKETEDLIAEFTNNNMYFRPPFGRWNSEMCKQLNSELKSTINYIGPIGWHIDGSDWWFWSKIDKNAAAKCATHYLKLIRTEKKGIVLMHDSSANRFIWAPIRKWNNKTLETVKIVVSTLKNEGYSFVSLNDIQFKNPT